MLDLSDIGITAVVSVAITWVLTSVTIRIFYPRMVKGLILNIQDYLKGFLDEMRKNPEQAKEIAKPIIMSILDDLQKELVKNPKTAIDLARAAPAVANMAIPFIPKKYQAIAQFAMMFFGNREGLLQSGQTSSNETKLG